MLMAPPPVEMVEEKPAPSGTVMVRGLAPPELTVTGVVAPLAVIVAVLPKKVSAGVLTVKAVPLVTVSVMPPATVIEPAVELNATLPPVPGVNV